MAERDPVIRVVADCPICGEDRSAEYTKSALERGAEPDEVFVAVRQVNPPEHYQGPVAPLHLVHLSHMN